MHFLDAGLDRVEHGAVGVAHLFLKRFESAREIAGGDFGLLAPGAVARILAALDQGIVGQVDGLLYFGKVFGSESGIVLVVRLAGRLERRGGVVHGTAGTLFQVGLGHGALKVRAHNAGNQEQRQGGRQETNPHQFFSSSVFRIRTRWRAWNSWSGLLPTLSARKRW